MNFSHAKCMEQHENILNFKNRTKMYYQEKDPQNVHTFIIYNKSIMGRKEI